MEFNTTSLNTIQRTVKTISCQNTGSKVSGLLPGHARRKFSQISSELAVHLFLCLCKVLKKMSYDCYTLCSLWQKVMVAPPILNTLTFCGGTFKIVKLGKSFKIILDLESV